MLGPFRAKHFYCVFMVKIFYYLATLSEVACSPLLARTT